MVSGGICKGESPPLALNQAPRRTVQESYSTGLWNLHTAVQAEIPGQVLTGATGVLRKYKQDSLPSGEGGGITVTRQRQKA